MSSDRFIPFLKKDIVQMCAERLNQHGDNTEFATFCTLLINRIHYEYHQKLESLKDHYAPFDPDKVTRNLRSVTPEDKIASQKAFAKEFAELLDSANFEQITDADLQDALTEESLFKVRLEVSFSDFAEVVFYRRGESKKTEVLRSFWGLRKKPLTFTNYDRVAVYITFKDEAYFKAQSKTPFGFTPGSTIVKLFQNVPKADLEMLFPNSEVRMRPIDKVVIGSSAAIGGVVVLVTKLGASILLLASLFAFWLGLKDEAVEVTTQHLITLGIGLGVFGSFIFKEWSKFKNRKIKFMKALSDNLYFKNLDNNSGVFHTLIDAAEEEDCKEAILAYTFLLQAPSEGLTDEKIDQQIEQWFKDKYDCELDFDVADALDKLVRMELVHYTGTHYTPRPINEAVKVLDEYWDGLHEF
ncbi:TMEM143 family protein [Alteromonas sp. ASW11-36]|uniref:TMEM143 family protein n=1 Tax=Alteromonas arenosi TaxID=3055817 RepID=A0ABT7SXZ6_9ALTE|nr:TMEM143 family protein [Alteromonas sp. ASW11-36]MDM7860399.1 TMEM143 family protein [Alteromonas sp. ASW11-36]